LSSLTDAIQTPAFEAGRLIKIFGVQGGLVIRLDHKVAAIIEIPDWAFLMIDGAPVPFRIRQEEFFLKDNGHLVVALSGLENPEAVARFIGLPVKFPGRIDDWFEQEDDEEPGITGYRVIDSVSGSEGIVTGLLDIPGNPLLELDFDGREILLPVSSEYVLKTDHRTKVVRVQIPDELFSL